MIAGNVETSQAVTSALFLALGVQAAAQSTMNNTTWGDDAAAVLRDGLRRDGGGGAVGRVGASGDERGAFAHDELAADRSRRCWSGGFRWCSTRSGCARGRAARGGSAAGDGVERRIRFLAPMTVAILSGHRVVPPPGLAGGGPGAVGRTRIVRADGRVEELASADKREVGPGDVFWLETPGGGGYGRG